MAAPSKKDSRYWTQEARRFAAEGNLVAALSSARNALRLDRRNFEAWHIGCETLLKQGRQWPALIFARALARYAPARGHEELREYAESRIAEMRAYFATYHRLMGYTDLTHAASKDDIEKARELLDSGEDINKQDTNRGTALHAAAGTGSPSLVRMLVERGADLEATNSLDETPLISAARYANRANVLELLRLGANVRHVPKSGHTLLWQAIFSMKDVEIVRLLMEAGVDPNETYEYGDNPFLLAISCQDAAICEYLLPLTKDPARMNKHQVSALHFCASYNDHSMIRKLLERGVDVNSTTNWGQTALMSACEKSSVDSVRVLLAHGARTDIETIYGETALSIAERLGNEEVLSLLRAVESGRGPSGNGKRQKNIKK